MSEPWFNTYTGIPFADHGRDRNGCDCYGLIRLVFTEQRGIELPLLLNVYAGTTERGEIARQIAEQPLLIGFAPVPLESVEPFDVLVLRQVGFNCHLALAVDARRILHTERGKGTTVEDFLRPHVRPRIREAWRYVG